MRSHMTVRAFELAAVDLAQAQMLEPAEHARAATLLHEVTRRDFLAGRIAQRHMASELLQLPPQKLRLGYVCPECGPNPHLSHGQPGYWIAGAPAPLSMSFSRSHGWGVAAMVSGTDQAMGVDVQQFAQVGFDGFDDVALSLTEKSRIARLAPGARQAWRATVWARKEALAKLSVMGLRTDPVLIPAFPEDEGSMWSGHAVELWDIAPAELGMPAGFAVAVAFSKSPLSAVAGDSARP